MTALLLVALVAQPTTDDRMCFEQSTESCLCLPETTLLRMKTKALAFDDLVANPPECGAATAGAWGTAALLLLEALRGVWGALSTRLIRDAEWEASWCFSGYDGHERPRWCFDGVSPIALRVGAAWIGEPPKVR